MLNPPSTPPCHKDRLFEGMKKYTRSPRATQLVPVYREFRLGHGDPLMQAVMKHWNEMAHPRRQTNENQDKEETKYTRGGLKDIPKLSSTSSESDDEKEIHLIQHGSPLGGLVGMHDIVHIGKDVIDVPILHFD